MIHPRIRFAAPYLGAFVAVAAAYATRALADPILGERQPFGTFLIAIIVAARFCGTGPAVAAVAASGFAARYFFMAPRGSVRLEGLDQEASFAVFLALAGFVILLIRREREAQEEAKRRTEAALEKQRELECEIVERQRIEAELRTSQGLFREFIDNGPFAAFIKDEQGRYVYVNRFVEREYARRPSDYLGKTDAEIYPAEQADSYARNDRHVFHLHASAHFEETSLSLDGKTQYWSTLKFPLVDELGRRTLGGICIDVTEIRRVEQRAKDSEARLLLALDAGRLGYWSWNIAADRVYSSEYQAVIHGRSPQETDTNLEEAMARIHPDDRPTIQEVIERAMRNEGPLHAVYRVVWSDGSIHWIEGTGRVFFDAAGKPIRIMGVGSDITERKRAEEALKESEERFRLLAMHAPVGIALCDVEGRTRFVNAKSCEMVGASADDVMGFDWQDYIHPDDRAELFDAWRSDIAAGKIHRSGPFRFLHKDGAIRWASATASLIYDAEGRPCGQIGITEDITERRDAERRFRDIYEQAPMGIAIIDSQSGRFLQINPKYERIIGRSEKEMCALTFQEITHPDDLAEDLDRMASLRDGTIRRFQMEKRLLRGDGSYMWANLTVVPMWQIGESPDCHLAMVEDVTARKEAEENLSDRELQLSGILDNSPAFIYLKDENGRYLLTNRRFQNVLVKVGEKTVGKTDMEIFPEFIARTFQESDATVWDRQTPHDFEEIALLPDGPHTFRSVKFPVRDASGKMLALGGISTDVSDLKEAHDALKAKQGLLRQLIEVQENEKQFLCQEFHDGLIQYAVGALMSLEGFRDKQSSTDAAYIIDNAIRNLRQGIEDGRRVIRGIRPAVLEDSGLEAAVEDLIGQYSTSGIMVTSNCDPKIGRLPDLMQTTVYRIVQEALSNARKYSGTDVVRIELTKSNDELHLEIQDFGCGFDVPSARKKGFGLIGMIERARLLGGECQIHSDSETGTRISVRLPLSPEEAN